MDSPSSTTTQFEDLSNSDNNEYQEVTDALRGMTLTDKPLAPSILFDMLGGRTMYEFAKLDGEVRQQVFSQHLKTDDVVEMYKFMDLSKLDATHSFLVLRGQFGNTEVGKQLAEEARKVFYEQNQFLVWLPDLEDFLDDILEGDDADFVAKSVRRITILIDRHQCCCENLMDPFQRTASLICHGNLLSITYKWRNCWEPYEGESEDEDGDCADVAH
ncbi:hypothetical protein BGZ63DRAFT_429165 [Mariannaea sp. PMI_226]|nr:hypothetical protein BGZ63DRAFT_429165 [Mariannaea sp. PMI_226]